MNLMSIKNWAMPLAVIVTVSSLGACSSQSVSNDSTSVDEDKRIELLVRDLSAPASGNVNKLLGESQNLIAQGNFSEASKLLDEAEAALGDGPQHLLILPVRGNIEFAMNQPDLAYKDYDRCLKDMKVSKDNLNSFKSSPILKDMIKICYFGRMMTASKKGDSKLAVEDAKRFREINDVDKTSADVYIAVFYIFNREFDKAQTQIESIKSTPEGKRMIADYEKALNVLKNVEDKAKLDNAVTMMKEDFWSSSVASVRATTMKQYQKIQ